MVKRDTWSGGYGFNVQYTLGNKAHCHQGNAEQGSCGGISCMFEFL